MNDSERFKFTEVKDFLPSVIKNRRIVELETQITKLQAQLKSAVELAELTFKETLMYIPSEDAWEDDDSILIPIHKRARDFLARLKVEK